MIDWIIGGIIALAAILAIIYIWKQKKAGKCVGCSSGGCEGCAKKGSCDQSK